MFCNDTAFKQDALYVDLPPTFLDLPVIQAAAFIRMFLRDVPGSFIVEYRNLDSFAAHVCKMLCNLPMASWPTSDAMAPGLNVAEATMRRRLKLKNYAYQSIRDDLRRNIAIGQLQDTCRTIADIAVMADFAEPNTFHRTFRKRTGMRSTSYQTERQASSRSAIRSSSQKRSPIRMTQRSMPKVSKPAL